MIQNYEQLARTDLHTAALDCLTAGIEAAAPARLTQAAVSLADGVLTVGESTYPLDEYNELLILGGGKAAAAVAMELEAILAERVTGGLVVTDLPAESSVAPQRVTVLAGDHPIPRDRGVEHTRRLLDVAAAADRETLILGVITGGGSALMTAPAGELSLADIQSTTDVLLTSGATIDEINTVRKHCSAIKGGQLAATTQPADVCSLVISDVADNDLPTIASGPLVGDPTTYADAIAVLDRHDCDVPSAIVDHLERGAAGEIDPTPPPGDPAVASVTTTVIGDGLTAAEAAADAARATGFDSLVLSSRIRGEARTAAKTQAAIAEEIRASDHPIAPPVVIVSGGETTVTVAGDGTGGPNQEFALAAAIELATAAGGTAADAATVVAAVDTDGIDGSSNAAGAIVDRETVMAAAGRRALATNNATPLLADADALIKTGPTGTNVNDLRVVVVGDS